MHVHGFNWIGCDVDKANVLFLIDRRGEVTCHRLKIAEARDPTHSCYQGEYLASHRALSIESVPFCIHSNDFLSKLERVKLLMG
jgi:hypothetical protein